MKWKDARQSANVVDQRLKNTPSVRGLADIYPVAARDNGNGFNGVQGIPIRSEGQGAIQNKRVSEKTGRISGTDGSGISDAVAAINGLSTSPMSSPDPYTPQSKVD